MSDYFIENTSETLKKIRLYFNDIESNFNLLKAKINTFLSFPLESSQKIISEINKFIEWLQEIDKSDKQNNIKTFENFHNSLGDIFQNYYETISLLYNNAFIKTIYEKNENIKKIIEELTIFDPPKTYNESDSKIDFSLEQSSLQFYDSNNNNNYDKFYGSNENISLYKDKENKKETLKCMHHLNEEGIYICYHCDFIFCEKCGEEIFKLNLYDHELKKISEIEAEKEKEKNFFLSSFMNIINGYILKCNNIINKRNDFQLNKFIIEKFQFPKIKDEKNFDSQIEFFKEINIVEKELIQLNNTDISINNEKINDSLSNYLLNNLKKLIGEKTSIMNDYNFLEYENNSFIDEKYVHGQDEESDEYGSQFDNIKNKFWYLINLIGKDNTIFNYNKFKEEILEEISDTLNIEKNNIFILYNNKTAFINHFIKTKIFTKLSPKALRINYPNLKLLYEYKLIIDCFFRLKCKIPIELFDFKYNFITPNLSLNRKRGTEIYNPPYGWFGIGLNVTKKYENEDWINNVDVSSKWAIGYYFFEKNLKNEEMIYKLNNIITKNEININEKYQIKMTSFNKRLNGKKIQRIGKGFYLSPDINLAEKNTGYISFNKKKYKIVLMVKVLIESIKEPDDESFWIISKKENIRIYRILIKEIC